jgi:hypothetical protein
MKKRDRFAEDVVRLCDGDLPAGTSPSMQSLKTTAPHHAAGRPISESAQSGKQTEGGST